MGRGVRLRKSSVQLKAELRIPHSLPMPFSLCEPVLYVLNTSYGPGTVLGLRETVGQPRPWLLFS